jgi:hypothetical protein
VNLYVTAEYRSTNPNGGVGEIRPCIGVRDAGGEDFYPATISGYEVRGVNKALSP